MKNNGWILASDKLPEEEGEVVLVYYKGGYYDTSCIFNGEWDSYHKDNIIAWKPIEECKFR